jgi:hypothetical protein
MKTRPGVPSGDQGPNTKPGGHVHPRGAWNGGGATQLVAAPSYGTVAMSPVIENDPIVDQNCDLGRFKL